MKQAALKGYADDPFLIKSSRALDRDVLAAAGLIPDHVLPRGNLSEPLDASNPRLRDSRSRHQAVQTEAREKRLLRFAMTATGGLLLIVPMIIMTEVPGKICSLVTTCVCMLVFAALVTFATNLGPNEVLATTAAYAAVLVVFVGTSMVPAS
ncbi:hypothetical protein EJ03DRAFT_105073 [Teratosphaeria nubilosa]|uniref:DUF6594 domain-containing protein n=1 Tax=Teratosphaeria nubilosa TaxID=161662 RepID=A0A6G1LNG0_9PEZI|nr:hypothetical protein EJ03DRAFT_105073 [Teratosphaeria nubilosa]